MSMQIALHKHARLSTSTKVSQPACSFRPNAAGSSRPVQSRHVVCRAEGDGQSNSEQQSTPVVTEEQKQQQKPPGEAPNAPLLKPGQGTAIVTGAISVLFGIAYLVLVQLLDMRGGELQPPPPEAYIP